MKWQEELMTDTDIL